MVDTTYGFQVTEMHTTTLRLPFRSMSIGIFCDKSLRVLSSFLAIKMYLDLK